MQGAVDQLQEMGFAAAAVQAALAATGGDFGAALQQLLDSGGGAVSAVGAGHAVVGSNTMAGGPSAAPQPEPRPPKTVSVNLPPFPPIDSLAEARPALTACRTGWRFERWCNCVERSGAV